MRVEIRDDRDDKVEGEGGGGGGMYHAAATSTFWCAILWSAMRKAESSKTQRLQHPTKARCVQERLQPSPLRYTRFTPCAQNAYFMQLRAHLFLRPRERVLCERGESCYLFIAKEING